MNNNYNELCFKKNNAGNSIIFLLVFTLYALREEYC